MSTSPPHTRLATLPTPLVRAAGLERALGDGPIWVKRDDLTGFGVAGNKARALEFLVGEAVDSGCDVVVAAGSPSSNFCAAAAMAAAVVGLECHLLYAGPDPGSGANIGLARAAGAELRFDAAVTREELDDAVMRHAATLRALGRRPYPMPRGGATPVGAIGYAFAARELVEQAEREGLSAGTLVVATGSGTTHAGLVAGTAGTPWHVVGASVSRPVPEVRERVLELSRQCAKMLGLASPAVEDVEVRDLRGPGFGVASDDDRLSAELALRSEGLLLDAYYGAKAMSLLRTLLRERHPAPLVFWHTGGLPAALAAYAEGGAS